MPWGNKYYSKILGMEYSYNAEKQIVMTQDRIVYTLEEVREIERTSGTITKEIHNSKKVFNGSIC